MNFISKITKYVGVVLLITLLLAGCSILFLNSKWGQKIAIEKVETFLSEGMKTEVTIGRFRLHSFEFGELHDVLIRGQKGDTLIYVHQLNFGFKYFDTDSTVLALSDVVIDGARVYFSDVDGEQNYGFLSNAFAPFDTVSSNAPVQLFTLLGRKVELKNSVFDLKLDGYQERTDDLFASNHIRLENIQAKLDHFVLYGDSIAFNSEGLSTVDHSGFKVDGLKGLVSISNAGILINNAIVKTNQSEINGDIEFKTTSYGDFSSFEKRVFWNLNLNEVLFNTSDLKYFGSAISPLELNVNGRITGRLSSLKGKKLAISYGDGTEILANAKIKGLPQVDAAFYDIDVISYKTNVSDLNQFLMLDRLPRELSRLKNFEYKGQFLGFLNDFVSYGTFKTPLGRLKTDVNMKIFGGTSQYSGRLSTQSFDLGTFYNVPNLTFVNLDMKVDGQGFLIENMKNRVEGRVNEITYHGYTYKNINLDGGFNQKKFNGNVVMNDEHVKLNFEGNMDFNEAKPKLNFQAKVAGADLHALNIDSTVTDVNVVINSNFYGLSLDDAVGSLELDSISFTKNEISYAFQAMKFNSSKTSEGHLLTLRSDIADIAVNGNYQFSEMGIYGRQIVNSLFPDYYTKLPNRKEGDMKIEFVLKNDRFVQALTDLNIRFDSIKGVAQYVAENDSFYASIESQDFGLDSIDLRYVDIRTSNSTIAPFEGDVFLGTMQLKGQSLMKEIQLSTHIKESSVDFDIQSSLDSGLFWVKSIGSFGFNNQIITGGLNDLQFGKGDALWHMLEENSAVYQYQNGAHVINGLNLINKDQKIGITGRFAQGTNRGIVMLSALNLKELVHLIDPAIKIGGVSTGKVDFRSSKNRYLVQGDMLIRKLEYNGDTIGDVSLKSNTLSNPKKLRVFAKVRSGDFDGMDVRGIIDFTTPEGDMDIAIDGPNVNPSLLGFVFDGLMSELEGNIAVKGHVKGPFGKPKFNLSYKWSDVSFLFDYTQVRYASNISGIVSDQEIMIKPSIIKDGKNGKAKMSGRITHDMFDQIKMSINIDEINNLHALNTVKDDNELFYGNAYATGSVSINGPIDHIKIDIEAEPEKGTRIKLPLETEPENVSAGYVKFVNGIEEANRNFETKTQLSGVELDMRLKLTEAATFDLIFNEQLDDRITAKGTGNLKMVVTTFGDFEMYGDFSIVEGLYHFSAMDIISKNFTISPGSKLGWDGSPYNAQMDVKAIKRENAAPYDLLVGQLSEEDLEAYKAKVPVDCELYLSGLLYSPEITFDFSMVNSNVISDNGLSALDGVLQRIKQDEEEQNMQVFSLLVLGSFIPPTFAGTSIGVGAGINSTINNSVGDIVSNQLSKWLSQIDPKWQVGVDYQSATEATRTELILSLRRKFWNDRFEIAGSIDANSGNGTNPYDVNIQYNVSQDGKFQVRGFQKSANDPTLGQATNVTTTGVGFYVRKEFDRFFKRKKKTKVVKDPS